MRVGGKVICGTSRAVNKGNPKGPARVTVTPLVHKSTTAKNAPLVKAAGGAGSKKAAR